MQLANPKAAVFMIAFYPQFVPADGAVFGTTALLGLLQITVETVEPKVPGGRRARSQQGMRHRDETLGCRGIRGSGSG